MLGECPRQDSNLPRNVEIVATSAPRATSANPKSMVNPALDGEAGLVTALPFSVKSWLHQELFAETARPNGASRQPR
jgi:hypothetical protein